MQLTISKLTVFLISGINWKRNDILLSGRGKYILCVIYREKDRNKAHKYCYFNSFLNDLYFVAILIDLKYQVTNIKTSGLDKINFN